MIPSVVATQVRNCVCDYLRTTFRPTNPGFEGLMERFLAESDNVCRGPYISIGLPFHPGTSATLGSNASQVDLLRYANEIFKDPFLEGALIEEDRLSAAEFLQDALLNVLPFLEAEVM